MIVTLAGIGLWVAGYAHYQGLLVMGMVTLAAVYFLFSYQPPKTEALSVRGKLGMRLLHIAASVAAVGVLFTLLPLEGAANMLAVGSASLVLATLFTLSILRASASAPERALLRAGLLRTAMITCLSVYLFVTTQQLWR